MLAGIAAGACASADAPATAHGVLVPVDALHHDRVAPELAALGIGSGTVRYGVRAYQLTCATARGGLPTTTGLLVLPRGGPHLLDLVSDTHATIATRKRRPLRRRQLQPVHPVPARLRLWRVRRRWPTVARV
ncbi:hypothetical protein ACFWIB_37180 [Streptomyces sp. NPDC127051]|uniref:hypothetical protein n=1 Tax=Streptomyces sp. NPDC127051 TaxID=3347119 RepID=UPI00364E0E58